MGIYPNFIRFKIHDKGELASLWVASKQCRNSLSLSSIGVWTQDFELAKQVLNHLRHTSSPFWLGHFVLVFCPGQPGCQSFSFWLHIDTRMAGMCHHAQLFSIEMGVSQPFFFLVWPMILQISACLPLSWSNRHIPLCPAIGWDGLSWTPCLRLCWTLILLISAFQVVAGPTCVSHQWPSRNHF
jgi:hypothetical protein